MRAPHSYSLYITAAIAGILASSDGAHAQEGLTEHVPTDDLAANDSDLNRGWNGKLTFNGSSNFASNDKVVGQTDGLSMLLGTGLDAKLQYDSFPHRWVTELSIAEMWARTPVVEEFVKSSDAVALESMYNYFIWEWGGVFARVAAETALFEGEHVTATDRFYVLDGGDPTMGGITADHFALSDPFQPLTLQESTGLFAEPVAGPALTLSTRLGFGGRHTFAEGARVIADDSGSFDDDGDMATDELPFTTYKELLDVHQAGLEIFAGIEGKIVDGRINYGLGASALIPFINNDDTDRDAMELTRIAVEGNLDTKLLDWLTIGYQLKVVSDPQLVDEVQVQHSVLLTAAVTAIDTFDPPVDEAAEKLKAAEQRADEAEARAVDAEKRATEAEAKVEAATTTPAAVAEPPPATTPEAAPSATDAAPAAPADADAAGPDAAAPDTLPADAAPTATDAAPAAQPPAATP